MLIRNWGMHLIVQVVHRLYAPGGAAVQPVGARFPSAIKGGGNDLNPLQCKGPAAANLPTIMHT